MDIYEAQDDGARDTEAEEGQDYEDLLIVGIVPEQMHNNNYSFRVISFNLNFHEDSNENVLIEKNACMVQFSPLWCVSCHGNFIPYQITYGRPPFRCLLSFLM